MLVRLGGLATSSPSTSTVASLPSAFSRRTTRTASSSVGPAMYGAASRRTIRLGTAGRTRATAVEPVEAPGRVRLLAHEPLAGGADERHRLGEEHAHRVAQRDRLLVGRCR